MLKSYKDDCKDCLMLKQKIIHINAELSKHKVKLKDYQENDHYSQFEILKDENFFLKERNKELEDYRRLEKEEYSKQVNELEEKLSLLSLNEKSFIAIIQLFIHQYQEDSKTISELEENEVTLINELGELKKTEENLYSKLKEKDLAIQQLQTENEQLWIENNDLQKLLDQKELKQNELSNQIQALKDVNKDYSNQMDKLQKKSAKVSEENQRLTLVIQDFSAIEEEYKEKIKQYLKELSLIKKNLEGTEEKLLGSQKDNEKLYTERQRLFAEKIALENVQKEMVSKIKLLKNEISTYSNDGKSSQSLKVNLNNGEILKVIDSLESMKLEVNHYDQTISACTQQINDLENQINVLTSIINNILDRTEESFDNIHPH